MPRTSLASSTGRRIQTRRSGVHGKGVFAAQDIAQEYYGHAPSSSELAATLIALYAAPMYFYKKAKGVFKAAPEETLKQALAAREGEIVPLVIAAADGFEPPILGFQVFFLRYTRGADQQCGDCHE